MKRMTIIAGTFGSGKSFNCMSFEEPILYLDMENKNEDMRKKYFSDKLIDRRDIFEFDDSFRETPEAYYKTYLNLKREIDVIISAGKDIRAKKKDSIGFNTLVVDGISFIRNKCMLAKWMNDHPKRKNPNEFEWKEINEGTKDLLFPLINMSVAGIIPALIFTSEFKDVYEVIDVFDESSNKVIKKSVVVGQEPAYKDYFGYKMYTLIELSVDKKTKRYKAFCSKSLIGMWDCDITDKSLYEEMVERGL